MECSYVLQGTRNFTVFQGTFRGNNRINKHFVNPICNVTNIEITFLPDKHIVNGVITKPFPMHNFVRTYEVILL